MEIDDLIEFAKGELTGLHHKALSNADIVDLLIDFAKRYELHWKVFIIHVWMHSLSR